MITATHQSRFNEEAKRALHALICLIVALSIFSSVNLRLPSVSDANAFGFPSSTLVHCNDNISINGKTNKPVNHESDCCAYCHFVESILKMKMPIFDYYFQNTIPLILFRIVVQHRASELFYFSELGILTSWSAHSPPH